MTLDDLDTMLEHLVAAATVSSDPEDGPGLITLSPDTRYGFGLNAGMACTNILKGIRYRGLRVIVSGQFEDAVFSRKEARGKGYSEFEDFQAKVAV